MRRREFIAGLASAAGAEAWSLMAWAQQPERIRQIAVLMGTSGDADDLEGQRHFAAFRQELQALGWTEDHNVRTDVRWAAGDASRMRTIVAEVVKQQPDAILVETTPQVAALMRENRTIPMVFVNVSDPIASGFVASMARPGGAITGFISNEPSLGSKWVQALHEVAPHVTRLGFMFNPDTAPYVSPFIQSSDAAATSYGLEMSAIPIHDESEMVDGVEAFAREPDGGLIVMPEIFTTVHAKQIVELANQNRLPAVYAFRFFPTSGGLISYGVDIADQFRRSASYLDRILRGEKPANLPVQAQVRLAMIINLKTARTLGLTIPEALLATADEVIQ
jgi:putative tryptophan/tyrosine transport system substrate-binding protein